MIADALGRIARGRLWPKQRRLNALVVLASSLLCTGAAAQPVGYTLDPDHSQPVFEVSHIGISTYRGKFARISGKIVLDPGAKTGAIDITIEPGEVLTGSRQLDRILQGEDFFDTQRFPVATFKASRVAFEQDRPRRIDGDLTLRGVTRPVTLEVDSFECAKHPIFAWREVCGAEATATLKRSEFGMTRYASSVGDEVKLLLSVEAFRD